MAFRFGQDRAGGGLAVTRYMGKPSETEVFVPEGAAVIGSAAFRGSIYIERAVLPGSVRRVMSYAFAECPRLRDIELGGTTEICKGAFADCRSLRKLYLPDSVKALRDEVFHGCTALSELRLPAAEPEDMSGLADCRSLSALVIGDLRFSVGGGTMMKDAAGFIYKCLERPDYLMRRFYGFDIDESFLYSFAYELYGYSLPGAREFIDARRAEMLRAGVVYGHIGIVKLLLELHGGGGVTDGLIDLAARQGSHQIYLLLIAGRHGEAGGEDGRFSL